MTTAHTNTVLCVLYSQSYIPAFTGFFPNLSQFNCRLFMITLNIVSYKWERVL